MISSPVMAPPSSMGHAAAQDHDAKFKQMFRELNCLRDFMQDVQAEHRVQSARLVDTNTRLGDAKNKMDYATRAYQEMWRMLTMMPGYEEARKEFEESAAHMDCFSMGMGTDTATATPASKTTTATATTMTNEAPILSLENALSFGDVSKPLLIPSRTDHGFVVVLCKSDTKGGSHIGAEFRPTVDSRLIVKKISESGLVAQYNSKVYSAKKVTVGDIILDVNGKIEPKLMMRECQNKKLLRMTVSRNKSEADSQNVQRPVASPQMQTTPAASPRESVCESMLGSTTCYEGQPYASQTTNIAPETYDSMWSDYDANSLAAHAGWATATDTQSQHCDPWGLGMSSKYDEALAYLHFQQQQLDAAVTANSGHATDTVADHGGWSTNESQSWASYIASQSAAAECYGSATTSAGERPVATTPVAVLPVASQVNGAGGHPENAIYGNEIAGPDHPHQAPKLDLDAMLFHGFRPSGEEPCRQSAPTVLSTAASTPETRTVMGTKNPKQSNKMPPRVAKHQDQAGSTGMSAASSPDNQAAVVVVPYGGGCDVSEMAEGKATLDDGTPSCQRRDAARVPA